MNDSRTCQVSVAPVIVRAPAGRALTGGSPVPGAGGVPPAVVVRHGPRRPVGCGAAERRRSWRRGHGRERAARELDLQPALDRARRGGASASRRCAAARRRSRRGGATASVSSVVRRPPSSAVTRGLAPSSSRGEPSVTLRAAWRAAAARPRSRSAVASPARERERDACGRCASPCPSVRTVTPRASSARSAFARRRSASARRTSRRACGRASQRARSASARPAPRASSRRRPRS